MLRLRVKGSGLGGLPRGVQEELLLISDIWHDLT